MTKLAITYQPIDALKLRANNPRTHSDRQIEQIAAMMQRVGFTNPILTEIDNTVIAGHGRIKAAKLIGMTEVPTVCLADMSEADIRAYVIADNRLAELAGWDSELLGLEFEYLSNLDIDLDPTITGFELADIDALIGKLSDDEDADDDPADYVPEIAHGPAVTKPGDIWNIGKHRLICGNALSLDSYHALFGEDRAQMVFTDPPYNVPIAGNVSGLGKVQHREFAMASGEMSKPQFTTFLSAVFQNLAAWSIDGSIHYQCIDWRHVGEMLAAGENAYSELKNICVWAKTNGGMGSLYRSQHELVFVFKAGTAPHINNVELGKHGRYRTNVWSHPGVNAFGDGRGDLALHPTVKPVALVVDAIRDCSHRKGRILDAFAGSGTTLIAAQKTGRRGYGIEIDPHYCDVIIRRMADVCGLDAVLEATGQRFAEVEAERLGPVQEAAE